MTPHARLATVFTSLVLAAALARPALALTDGVVTLDPLPTVTAGQDTPTVVVAHLTSGNGPVGQGRLILVIDGQEADNQFTDGDGNAQLSFKRPLSVGTHQLEVKFLGSRRVEPATASAPLQVVGAGATVLKLDPLPVLQLGQDPSGTVGAHLATNGAPVAGARLTLLFDGTPVGSEVTDSGGTAQIRFRRDLAAGPHQVDVKFDGSKSVAPASASAQLQVQAASASTLTLDPLPVLQAGRDPSGVVVAHLSSAGGPVAGARLTLVLDGASMGSEVTDPNGTAQIRFRRDLADGPHQVDVKFDGSRAAAPTSASARLQVLPASTASLTIDPLPTLKLGQDPTVVVSAHLTSDGTPVAGARLGLIVDGAPVGSGVTDAYGSATLRLRRDLTAGDHQVDVKFDGSKGVAPASATSTLSVQPLDNSQVTIDPLPVLRVGRDPGATVIAHLTTEGGDPVPGARVGLLLDSTPAGSGLTDANGATELRFRRDLTAGPHQIDVKFDGSRAVAPASASAELLVQDAVVNGLTMDPLPVLQTGQDPAIKVVAHLIDQSGAAVAGERLALVIDGAPAGSSLTDATGMGEFHVRRDLAAGQHEVEVRFDGSRAEAPASTSRSLTVLPVAVHGLSVEPLPPRAAGEDPAATVVAHMVSDAGEAVSGARLELLVDDVPAGSSLTDAQGVAQLRFRRDLLPGEHTLQVRFAGDRATAPASVVQQVVVLPPAVSGLTIEPLPVLKVGQDSLTTVVVHLVSENGQPVGGARLELLVDGAQERLGSTDASGTAQLKFRPDLLPGEHRLEVRFGGYRGVTAATVSRSLVVEPAEVEVQVTPARAGARIAVNGRIFTSGEDGIARLEMDKPGAYHLEALDWDTGEPGKQLRFSRWGDEVFTPARDVVVPQITNLEVGFDTSFQVGLTYLDPDGKPVNPQRVASATLASNVGAAYTFLPGEQKWLPGMRVVRRAGGLGETPLEYSVDSVMLEGANVVNSKEQRFTLSPNLTFGAVLILHSMRVNARDALFGTPIGSRVWLQHPDGRLESYEFGPNREVSLVSLPRGQYVARVDAPGMSFPQPIALSRDQDVELKVVSERDLIAGFLALAALAVGLLLIGRPRLVAVLTPRAGSLSLVVARFAVRGRALGEEES